MNERDIERLIERLTNRVEEANTYFLMKIGASINQIKKLKPSQAHQLIQMLRYGASYDDIIKKLMQFLNMNIKELDNIFSIYAENDQNFYEKFYKYRNIPFIPFNENEALKRQKEAILNMARNEMYNFTRSNVIGYTIRDNNNNVIFKGLRETYNQLLDTAFLNVGQGKETFDSSIRKILKDIGKSGLKTLDYESGRSIRLDSAISMQLKGKLRELHNENQKIIGNEIDADGIEISVHLNPAPDHQEVQGKQLSNEEFEKLQTTGKATTYDNKEINMHMYRKDGSEINSYRPISEMNCYHFAFSIILGVDEPQFSDKVLQKIIDNNNKGFDFEGKHYSMYEGEQLQRRLEAEIRKQKDIQILGRTSDDEDLANEAQYKINVLTNKYKKLSDESGLDIKKDRLAVSGYRRIKLKDNYSQKLN